VSFIAPHFVQQRLTVSIESECQKLTPRLPAQWNSSFGSHTFLYAHSQSSMQYVVKVDRLGGKAEIRGIGLGDERISRFEITAKDYVSSSALPLRISMNENGEEDRSNLTSKLKEVFISESRIKGEFRDSFVIFDYGLQMLTIHFRSGFTLQDHHHTEVVTKSAQRRI
jgi:hypothetical protein